MLLIFLIIFNIKQYLGLGLKQVQVSQTPVDKKCSVYVAGLPQDITEAEVGAFSLLFYYFLLTISTTKHYLSHWRSFSFKSKDILFSKIGSIRKVKLYRDSNGVKKGDALITYFKPEIVNVAIKQVKVFWTFLCTKLDQVYLSGFYIDLLI